MPGETLQTIKEKTARQARKSGMSREAAQDYGSAMAARSATVGGATGDKEFMGEQLHPLAATAIAQQGTTENIQQQAAARQAAEKKKQEYGGVYNPKKGIVTYGPDELSLEDYEKKIDKKDDIDKPKKAPGVLQNLAADWGGGVFVKLMQAFLGKEPTKEQLADPNFLAMMFDQLDKKKGAVDQFVEDYKGTMADALGMPPTMANRDDAAKTAFYNQLENAKQEAIDSGIFQGSEAQRRLEPWDYYNPDLWEGSAEQAAAMEGYPKFLTDMGLKPMSSRFANTMGNLEDIANIPVTAKMQGENPDFVRQIFEARETVSRQKDAQDRRDAGGGGGDVGIPSISLPDPSDPTPDPTPTPDLPTPPTLPPTLPPGATLTPTPHDYSQWPQYPGYPTYGPAGGPVPNYVNQGLGQAPQFDYWNQIARTFPGMT